MQNSEIERPTVLIAEDDADTGFLLSTVLGTAGIRSEVFSSGEDALAAVAAGQSFHCAAIDLHLSDMSGHELLQKLRGLGYQGMTVAMSVLGREECAIELSDWGFFTFVCKTDGTASLLQIFKGLCTEADAKSPAREYAPAPIRSSALQLFIDAIPERIADCREKFVNSDKVGACRLLHKIRGACEVYEYKVLASDFAALERIAGVDSSQSELIKALDQIESEFHRSESCSHVSS